MIADLLEAARSFVAARWSEGDFFWRCSVLDALYRAAKLEGGDVWAAHQALEAVVLPGATAYNQLGDRAAAGDDFDAAELRTLAGLAAKCTTLEAWLSQPGRRHAEVLRAFDVAILKARDPRAT